MHIQGKRQKMDRHTPKGSVRTGHGVPCGALPLIKTKKKKKKKKKEKNKKERRKKEKKIKKKKTC